MNLARLMVDALIFNHVLLSGFDPMKLVSRHLTVLSGIVSTLEAWFLKHTFGEINCCLVGIRDKMIVIYIIPRGTFAVLA